jgi:hypothetical protein
MRISDGKCSEAISSCQSIGLYLRCVFRSFHQEVLDQSIHTGVFILRLNITEDCCANWRRLEIEKKNKWMKIAAGIELIKLMIVLFWCVLSGASLGCNFSNDCFEIAFLLQCCSNEA